MSLETAESSTNIIFFAFLQVNMNIEGSPMMNKYWPLIYTNDKSNLFI